MSEIERLRKALNEIAEILKGIPEGLGHGANDDIDVVLNLIEETLSEDRSV